MKNRKGTINFGLVILVLIVLFLFGAFRPAFVIPSDLGNEGIIYQYAGEFGKMWYSGEGCQEDRIIKENNIVLSQEQDIKVGENNYKFVTSGVTQAHTSSSECSGVAYSVSVLKNGVLIDSVGVSPSVQRCVFENRFERNYDGIEATFGYAGDRYGETKCEGRKTYVVHRYKLPITNEPDAEEVSAEPYNTEIITVSDSWWSKFLNWLSNLFGGVF